MLAHTSTRGVPTFTRYSPPGTLVAKETFCQVYRSLGGLSSEQAFGIFFKKPPPSPSLYARNIDIYLEREREGWGVTLSEGPLSFVMDT